MGVRKSSGGEVAQGGGSRQVGSLFLLTNETDIHTKVVEIKNLRRQLLNAEVRQQGYGTAQGYQLAVKVISNQISQLKAEIQNVTQQMSRLPRGRRGGLANSVVTEQYNEFQMYRNQLQVQVNETTAYLNQFKSQPFDPKTKTKLDAEVAQCRLTYDQAVVDLRGNDRQGTEAHPRSCVG